MQCSAKIKAFIGVGIAVCVGVLWLAPFTQAKDSNLIDTEVVASQGADGPHFNKMDEISGIALAGYLDESGSPLLWGHEEQTSRLILIRTRLTGSLYAGQITLPGNKTRDAEDIATVHSNGRGTIYLEDAGSNRKDKPACVRYARKKGNPARCTVADSVAQSANTKDKSGQKNLKEACLARGDDWIFLNETDYLAPGAHPAIRRIPEPSYQDARRAQLAVGSATIEFEYPRMCGGKPCRDFPGNKMSDISAAYNVESLAVVAEPDHSHTAYLFTKAPLSLAHVLQTQRPDAAACKFASDGLSDVFRLRNIDSLPPAKLHQAEYVTTLDFDDNAGLSDSDDSLDRVTAANFLQLSDSRGLLLVKTTGHAYKWPISLASEKKLKGKPSTLFDIAGALKNIKPVLAAVPATNKKQGVGRRNQEAATQLDESTLYYMGECKGLPKCSVTMIHDDNQ